MERLALKTDIIDKTWTPLGWGVACSRIQDVAFDVLTDKELIKITKNSQKDFDECDGSDFLVMNGKYFDWKEFGYRYRDIIAAYLDYYTNDQLKLIASHL